MNRQEFEEQWRGAVEGVLASMKQWRREHPRATLEELETEVDARLAPVRAELLQHLALHSGSTHWQHAPPEARPRCPECQAPLQSRGKGVRRLRTSGDQALVLERSYGVCPQCGRGFFPSG